LFKNSAALEQALTVTAVVLDKTGTITRGEPALTDAVPGGSETRETLLQVAASAEKGSLSLVGCF
jgi:P-type Cu+ transporter